MSREASKARTESSDARSESRVRTCSENDSDAGFELAGCHFPPKGGIRASRADPRSGSRVRLFLGHLCTIWPGNAFVFFSAISAPFGLEMRESASLQHGYGAQRHHGQEWSVSGVARDARTRGGEHGTAHPHERQWVQIVRISSLPRCMMYPVWTPAGPTHLRTRMWSAEAVRNKRQLRSEQRLCKETTCTVTNSERSESAFACWHLLHAGTMIQPRRSQHKQRSSSSARSRC